MVLPRQEPRDNGSLCGAITLDICEYCNDPKTTPRGRLIVPFRFSIVVDLPVR